MLVTPLELDVVMGGQVVSEGAQACRRLLAETVSLLSIFRMSISPSYGSDSSPDRAQRT